MASIDPPGLACLYRLFSQRATRIYILVENFSFELACDAGTGRWHFESEFHIDDEDGERRKFEDTLAYPPVVTDRVRRAAAFARAYCDIDVDECIGVDAFSRLEPRARCQ